MPTVEPWQIANGPEEATTGQLLSTSAALAIYPDDLTWALRTISERRDSYFEYQAYYMGAHRLAFSTEGYRRAFATMVARLKANICPAVISAFADKLSVVGFTPHTGMVAGDTSAVAADKTEADQAWALWEDSDLATLADEVHDDALVNGDGYVIVWPDAEGTARFYSADAACMAIRYDTERREVVEVAAKIWQSGKRWRLTLYYPDRLEKYITRKETKNSAIFPNSPREFEPYQADGDVAWPLPNPYGLVPVFHFAPAGRLGSVGLSELGDVLPLQDALNKALADLIVAEEFGAYVQRYATGVEKEQRFNTTSGEYEEAELPFKVGIDRILTVASDTARFGQFNPTDLSKFIAVVDSHFALVGRVKGIPQHYFYMMSGNFPSGESQSVAEGRLVKRAERLHRRFGGVWARALAFALRINGVGDGRLAFRTKWQSAEPRSAADAVTNYKTAIDAGMPAHTAAQRYLDMSDEEIDAMIEQKDAESQQAAETAQVAFSRAMDRGAGLPANPKQQPPPAQQQGR